MSRGLLNRTARQATADPEDFWFEQLAEARLTKQEQPQKKTMTRERLSDRWIFSRPVDRLFAKLQDELAAQGQVDKIRALRQAMDAPWIRVQIRGEGEHRFGFLPAGSFSPAPDPTPVDRPDSWDF